MQCPLLVSGRRNRNMSLFYLPASFNREYTDFSGEYLVLEILNMVHLANRRQHWRQKALKRCFKRKQQQKRDRVKRVGFLSRIWTSEQEQANGNCYQYFLLLKAGNVLSWITVQTEEYISVKLKLLDICKYICICIPDLTILLSGGLIDG